MPAETQAIRAIAKEAYLYGFPMVEAYKTLYAQAVEHGLLAGPNNAIKSSIDLAGFSVTLKKLPKR